MKTSLSQLPEHKQQELHSAVTLIRDAVNVEMIILFGSYARGDWVEEKAPDGHYYQYQSDFDILVVVEKPGTADNVSLWRRTEIKIRQMMTTPISLIVHDIDFVNRRLRKGQYFFTDIKKEGICLFDSKRFELAEPKELSPKERKLLAEEDFTYWFNSANDFYETSQFNFEKGNYALAAFELHQTTERLYSATLLVYTRYKPSTHDLETLSKLVAGQEPQFLTIFPQGTQEQRHRFELLRKGYVDARYKPSYTITREELEWLRERVQALQQLTEKLCREKIASFVQ